jgi:hypothetical protein
LRRRCLTRVGGRRYTFASCGPFPPRVNVSPSVGSASAHSGPRTRRGLASNTPAGDGGREPGLGEHGARARSAILTTGCSQQRKRDDSMKTLLWSVRRSCWISAHELDSSRHTHVCVRCPNTRSCHAPRSSHRCARYTGSWSMLSDLSWSRCVGSAMVARHSRVQRTPRQPRHPGLVWGTRQQSGPVPKLHGVRQPLARSCSGQCQTLHIRCAMTQAVGK